MSDYTPSTEEVRGRHNANATLNGRTWRRAEAEFDRWLTQYTAEKRTEWEAGQGWVPVVLARETAGEGDWIVSAWKPAEIEEASRQFPDSEYMPGMAAWAPVEP